MVGICTDFGNAKQVVLVTSLMSARKINMQTSEFLGHSLHGVENANRSAETLIHANVSMWQ